VTIFPTLLLFRARAEAMRASPAWRHSRPRGCSGRSRPPSDDTTSRPPSWSATAQVFGHGWSSGQQGGRDINFGPSEVQGWHGAGGRGGRRSHPSFSTISHNAYYV